MQIFYVVCVRDRKVRAYINAIRLICNSTEKSPAHITVRGPYRRHLSTNSLKKFNSIIESSIIRVFGVDNFFESDQNTVFFRCGSYLLKKVWKKRDYGYNPHITIYDGKQRDFAEKIFELSKKHTFGFYFTVTDLRPLVTVKGQAKFPLVADFDDEIIYPAVGEHLDLPKIIQMQEYEKLALIDQLFYCLGKLGPSRQSLEQLGVQADEPTAPYRQPIMIPS